MRIIPLAVLSFPVSLVCLAHCVGDAPVTAPVDGGGQDTSLPDTSSVMDSSPGPDTNVPDTSKPCDTDAGMLVCSGACVDPTSDSANCGACAHDCGGGKCTASACQPVILTTVTTGASSLSRIATDGTYVVYTINDLSTNGGGVYSLSVTGAAQTPTTIASSTTNQNAGPITAVKGDVYWIQSSSSASNSAWSGKGGKAGASQLSNVINLGGFGAWAPYGIAVDSAETYLAYIEFDGAANSITVGSCGLPSGSCSSFNNSTAYPPGPGLVTDDTHIFWTQHGGSVIMTNLSIGTQNNIATSQATPDPIAIDATGGYVYWGNNGLSSSQLTKSPILSPSAASIGTGAATAMVADTKYLYWIDYVTNTISYIATTGTGMVKTLVPSSVVMNGTAMARDSKAIYWINKGDGTIQKIALPL